MAQQVILELRRIHAIDGEEQRRERLREHRRVAHRHRADGVAVIRVTKRDDAPPLGIAPVLPVLQGHLHGDFDGRRSVVGIEDSRQPGRKNADEPFGEFDRRLVRRAGEDHVFDLLRLLGNRLVQPRMRVAVDVHPPRRDAVEQLASVLGIEIDALAADDRQRRRRRLHLRIRMPDDGPVAIDEAHRSIASRWLPRSNSVVDHAASRSGVSGSNIGISPSMGTAPYCSIASRLSRFGGPTITTPAT